MTQLKAEVRDVFGKKLSEARKAGKLPAVVYGLKKEPVSIFVPLGEFKKVFKEAGESGVVELDMGGKSDNVLVHEIESDPLGSEPIHVDFYRIDLNKPITASVPLVFEGVSPAMKELSGVLVKVIHELELEALPKNMPHELSVDISKLATFQDRVVISDIKLPEGVKALGNADEVVALVEEPREEEVEEQPMTLEDIEVEKKGKTEEEGEEGEETKEEKK